MNGQPEFPALLTALAKAISGSARSLRGLGIVNTEGSMAFGEARYPILFEPSPEAAAEAERRAMIT